MDVFESTPAPLSDQDQKFLGIAQKLIDVELEMRMEDEEETAVKYSSEQVKSIALKLLNSYKKDT